MSNQRHRCVAYAIDKQTKATTTIDHRTPTRQLRAIQHELEEKAVVHGAYESPETSLLDPARFEEERTAQAGGGC